MSGVKRVDVLHSTKGGDFYPVSMVHESDYDQLAADNKRLREAITLALNEVDGNIRPAVRDLVNRLAGVQNGANPNDIYDYCDAIDAALSAGSQKEQGE